MRTVTKISQLTVAAALGLSLAACGSSSSSGSSTSAAGATGAATSQPAPATGSATGGSDASSAAPSGDASESSSSASGGDEAGVPDAKSLMHDARAAYRKAKSAHLHARIKQDSSTTQIIDIKGTIDGTNQEASVSETGQGEATFRTVSNKTYLKADKAFWTKAGKVTPTVAAKLADKWVIAPASTKSKLSTITIKYFLDGVLGEENLSDSELAKAKSSKSTYQGKDVYVVTDDSSTGGGITLAADSKDFLRLLPPADQSDEGEVTADGWNQQDEVKAPTGAIDASSVK